MAGRTTNQALRISVVLSGLMLAAGLAGCGKTDTSASLLADAKKYQQKGDNTSALIQLKNAVATSPDDGEARYQLSAFYLNSGDVVSAEKEIRKAMSLNIGADRTLPILGKALLVQGQFQKVLDELKPEMAQRSATLLALRGDAWLALNDPAKAKESYEQALAIAPANGEALIGMARYSILQKDAFGADTYTADALSKDPRNPEVWMFKGAMQRSRGKPEEALAAFSQALALKPDQRSAHIDKAQMHIALGKYDEAKADLVAANKVTPGSLAVLYTQALLDFDTGKYAQARDGLLKVLRAAPDHLQSILLAGAVELKLGSLQQAEQHLRKYLESFPDNLNARKLLVQTLLLSSQPGPAATALAPALKAASTTRDAHLLALAGETAMKNKDFAKAAGYFNQAVALAPKNAGLHTALGVSQMGQGDQAKAIGELELGASMESKSAEAGMALVKAQLGLRRFDQALASVQALEQQHPKDPQVQALKGSVYVAKGDLANARASFDKALAQQPDYFPATANLARLDVQDHKPQEAKKRFEAILAKDKKNIDALSALADLAIAQGRADEATSWLEKASAENPDAVTPALKLAGMYLYTQQPQKALTLVRKAQTANSTNTGLMDLLGQAQLATGDRAGALDTYSKLVSLAPKSALAHTQLAGVHAALDNYAAATDDLKRAVALDPGLLPARVGQIQLALRKKNPDEALAVAREVQKLDGKAALGFILESDVQLGLNKPALALAALEKAQALDKSPQLMLKIAALMNQTGKGKEVEARLLQWQKANPNDVVVAMYLAENSLREKQYKVAIARFEAIVKQAPTNAAAFNNLAWAYQQEKDPRALATAERAAQLAPDNPAVLDTLGWILLEQGQGARALPLLQKASNLAPTAPGIRFHLAAALNKSGDKINARKELDKLLSDNKSFPQIEDAKALLKLL